MGSKTEGMTSEEKAGRKAAKKAKKAAAGECFLQPTTT